MPLFGLRSQEQLLTCHPEIIDVLQQAILYFDFSVLEGIRSETEQNARKKEGTSKLNWPDSNHNVNPRNPKSQLFPDKSIAVDIVPYPVNWDHLQSFIWLSQVIKRCAYKRSVEMQWGYDLWGWDMPHWQLKTGSYD